MRDDESGEVVDDRLHVGRGPVEQLDDRDVDMQVLTGVARAQSDDRRPGMDPDTGSAPCAGVDGAVPGTGYRVLRETWMRFSRWASRANARIGM